MSLYFHGLNYGPKVSFQHKLKHIIPATSITNVHYYPGRGYLKLKASQVIVAIVGILRSCGK